MTIKRDNILNVSLELFANQGYVNTSTSKIAKAAGVSEGLIFRHFGNKEGLLDAIVAIGTQSIEDYTTELLNENDPKKIISQAIDFPVIIMKENKDYWQLVSSLKFQSPEIAAKYHNTEIFKQLEEILEKAFTKLNYENPEMEMKYLFLTIAGLSSMHKQNKDEEANLNLVNFIKSKYIN
ncbi:MAG: TetR/AcrR family transcriptional regulator [Bacteroidales bacterium]|nr:TetR/AcrR family transcriptional regulator [Bacteroidales bacterium]